jgi:arylsulfatase
MKMMLKHSRPGIINPEDERLWLMQLNYYLQLHILNDLCLQKILFTLDQKDLWKNTVIIFTSDHGDQCGSHKLRSKGPWNYQETMNVPLYIVSPEWNGPRVTNNLTSHIDLAPTIFNLAGSNKKFEYKFEGKNLIDILDNPSVPIREYVYFAQEWPWYPGVEKVRYASSGFFDGRFKYARYYGVGGGVTNMGLEMTGKMEIKRNAPFDLVEHELYDLQEDPFELNNLGQTKSSKRSLTKKQFQRLYEIENKIGI